jgi:hypothetical protein
MATEKQIAANRRNAAKSSGPRTAAGKSRSKMNALRHGLAARLEGALSEGFLGIEALSDRVTQIEAEKVRLCQEIERGLEQGDIQQIAPQLRRLSALDRYAQRCFSSLRKR